RLTLRSDDRRDVRRVVHEADLNPSTLWPPHGQDRGGGRANPRAAADDQRRLRAVDRAPHDRRDWGGDSATGKDGVTDAPYLETKERFWVLEAIDKRHWSGTQGRRRCHAPVEVRQFHSL